MNPDWTSAQLKELQAKREVVSYARTTLEAIKDFLTDPDKYPPGFNRILLVMIGNTLTKIDSC